jgi:hypothetical protein
MIHHLFGDITFSFSHLTHFLYVSIAIAQRTGKIKKLLALQEEMII